ncbi:alanine--tRNA ligase [Clostridium sp. YIM B02505]|uniref:Alanine--tRNA ligase n=1 Tax=Clostridium yunnanense TaxID=2800325 RepID=A0ABS1ETY6_9CLOT|nr:alanine--tRNA ligase [Clostridium yunnanense]MBK1812832.1 alanine--tRNA ligase [Clostridium yunnanense]
MKANELRKMYVEFFEKRGHKEIGSASLLPENDPTVLFTTAGMHPLVPYLLGEKHPEGKRLVDVQKCIRTGDIDEVGDDTHLTFFEMLGNWSLGDYFKEESITMSYIFLTEYLNIPVERLAVTVFEGDSVVARDNEAAELWMRNGLKKEQIYFYGRSENWWGPAGKTGPCGPDTEIFYDMGKEKCGEDCGPACSCGKYVEIWNNVFMEYNKNEDGTYSELLQKNVDTGMGLERILTVINNFKNVYETDLFQPIINKIEDITDTKYTEENKEIYRIISDHMRAATFILGDFKRIVPSNSEQGYILRRIIRRTIRLVKKLGVNRNIVCDIAEVVVENYGETYSELFTNKAFILEQLEKEYLLFSKTLDSGLKMAEKYFSKLEEGNRLSGDLAFKLYDTFGFPIEFTVELASERKINVDMPAFEQKFKEHQEKSRKGAAEKFKGGLADNSERTTKLHTATHLLNAALRKVLGDSVYQRGSNINSERLRFDFSFDRKMTKEELEQVEKIVNEAIEKGIDVMCTEQTVEQAKSDGAIGVFESKYGEIVKVYTIPGYSKEICGGPHASNTAELKSFKILKEESSSSGVRRIKATIG